MSLHNTSKLTLMTLSLLFRFQPHPGSLTPSERRFERSMTTGTRTLLIDTVNLGTSFFMTKLETIFSVRILSDFWDTLKIQVIL